MKDAYIFDIDGTLMDCSHRLHHIQKDPKDWRAFFAACAQDKPISHMVRLAINLFDADQHIVYVSGRSDECMDETCLSLAWAGLPDAPLIHAPRPGDHRDDDVLEIRTAGSGYCCGDIILASWRSMIGQRVVRMWRARGKFRAVRSQKVIFKEPWRMTCKTTTDRAHGDQIDRWGLLQKRERQAAAPRS